jgi:hypothetical protein
MMPPIDGIEIGFLSGAALSFLALLAGIALLMLS